MNKTTRNKNNNSWLTSNNWTGIGVIISLSGVIVSLIFSYFSYRQNNIDKNNEEIRYLETQKKITIEEYINTAREWFSYGEYDKSFEYYLKVDSLAPDNDEGYRKFLNMGKNLKATKKDGRCDPVIKTFFLRAQQLKNTPEINQELNKCE